MSTLIGIPCYKNAGVTRECLESIEGVDVLLVDNGADKDVSDVISEYDCDKIILKQNIGVNPAWNLILKHFLDGDWDNLFIHSSDVVFHHKAISIVLDRLKAKPNDIPIPVSVDKNNYLLNKVSTKVLTGIVAKKGTAGISIVLTREQALEVYPIPKGITLWFGDEYIYTILRKKYDTVVVHNFLVFHYGSQGIQYTPNVSEIIEQDKKAWQQIKKTL